MLLMVNAITQRWTQQSTCMRVLVNLSNSTATFHRCTLCKQKFLRNIYVFTEFHRSLHSASRSDIKHSVQTFKSATLAASIQCELQWAAAVSVFITAIWLHQKQFVSCTFAPLRPLWSTREKYTRYCYPPLLVDRKIFFLQMRSSGIWYVYVMQ